MANIEITGHNPSQTPQHPQATEDVFYTGLVQPEEFYKRLLNVFGQPEYDTELVEWNTKSNRVNIHPGIGRTWMANCEMSNDNNHDVLMGISTRKRLGVLVVKDCAWTTQPQGFNEDVALTLMEEGFDVAIIGPQIGYEMDLAENAHVTNTILDEIHRRGIADTDAVAVEGYSRGAMIGFGTVSRAHLHNRHVLYANLTDPCVANKVEFCPKKGLEATVGLPAEIVTGLFKFGSLMAHPRRLWHYRNSIDLSAEGREQIVYTGKPLFTGEAGILAGQMPQNAEATVAFFLHSFANDRKIYKGILKGKESSLRPGVEFKHTIGGHGQGMDQKILGNIGLRFARLGEQLREGALPHELDYTRIHRIPKKR